MEKKHFIGVLSLQLALLKELLALLGQETLELANMNLEEMALLNQRKEETAARLEVQSAALRQAISEYAADLGLPLETPLGDVVSVLAHKEIAQIHLDLNIVASRVQEVAAINREIAERFAETANISLNLLTRLIKQSSIYGASGGYQERPTGAIMINREA